MGDLISRDDTLKITADTFFLYGTNSKAEREIISLISRMPSAEPKKAKWSCSDDIYETAICTACDWNSQEPFDYILKNFSFCPNCGAKMEMEE